MALEDRARDNTQHISAPCISHHCTNVHQCHQCTCTMGTNVHQCTYTMGTNVHHTMTCTPKVAAGMHLARRGVGGAWLPCQPFTKFQTFKCRCKKKSDKYIVMKKHSLSSNNLHVYNPHKQLFVFVVLYLCICKKNDFL